MSAYSKGNGFTPKDEAKSAKFTSSMLLVVMMAVVGRSVSESKTELYMTLTLWIVIVAMIAMVANIAYSVYRRKNITQ